MGEVLNTPPFPTLEWDDYWWSASVVLPVWAGFSSPPPSYVKQPRTPSDGTAELNVKTPDDEPSPPSAAQAASYEYLVANQEAVRDAILQAVFDVYSEWRDNYVEEGDEAQDWMPTIENPLDLKNLIELTTVHMFSVVKDDLAYVGYIFRCAWDDEHGMGAMMHGSRVVEIGGADTAILDWIAEGDVEGRAESESEET